MDLRYRLYINAGKTFVKGILYLLIFPIYFFLPRYKHYIFVISTGRSGTRSLAESLQGSAQVRSFHEPSPLMGNSLLLKPIPLKIWHKFLFYACKLPKILLSCTKESTIYLESNHMFIKYFYKDAHRVFGNKMRIIHLRRTPYRAANSLYRVGRIPGGPHGNKWYLDPMAKDNLLSYTRICQKLKSAYAPEYTDFYKCLWYCFEIDRRADRFKTTFPKVKTIECSTEALNNRKKLIADLNTALAISLPPATQFKPKNKIDRNLKKKKKGEAMAEEKAKEITVQFQEALAKI